jgi:hypothetical protein
MGPRLFSLARQAETESLADANPIDPQYAACFGTEETHGLVGLGDLVEHYAAELSGEIGKGWSLTEVPPCRALAPGDPGTRARLLLFMKALVPK